VVTNAEIQKLKSETGQYGAAGAAIPEDWLDKARMGAPAGVASSEQQ
jgi:hypothetical protein